MPSDNSMTFIPPFPSARINTPLILSSQANPYLIIKNLLHSFFKYSLSDLSRYELCVSIVLCATIPVAWSTTKPLIKNSFSFYRPMNTDDSLIEEIKAFHQFISRDGENNQEKAFEYISTFFCKHNFSYNKVIQLIATKIETADNRNEQYTMSAYGYAFYSYDTEMCLMLQEHMDEKTKSKVHGECKEILLTHKRFDLTPLLDAYQHYEDLIKKLLWENNKNDSAWEEAYLYWQIDIGNLLKKIPNRLIQEFCTTTNADYANVYEETLKNRVKDPAFARSTLIYHYHSNDYSSWQDAQWGTFVLCKGALNRATAVAPIYPFLELFGSYVTLDFERLKIFQQVRTTHDLKYIFDALKPEQLSMKIQPQ